MATTDNRWTNVCSLSELLPDTGLCALLGSEQVAVFRDRQTDSIWGISNYDPIGQANVLSRGIVGSIDDEPVVASPLYKQHFNLRTGRCLEEPDLQLKTYAIRVVGDQVHLKQQC